MFLGTLENAELPNKASSRIMPFYEYERESEAGPQPKPIPTFELIQSTALVQGDASTAPGIFELPLELRNLIYGHIFRVKLNSRCLSDCSWQTRLKKWAGFRVTRQANFDHNFHQMMPCVDLIRTCKQVYREALPLLYHDVMFCYSNIQHLNDILDRVGPNGRACIRSLGQWYLPGNFQGAPQLGTLTPIKHKLDVLTKMQITLYQSHYAFDKTGDDMHPACVFRGVTLEVQPEYYTGKSDWYKEHEKDCEAFAAKMIAHVAQPRICIKLRIDSSADTEASNE